MNKKPYAKIDPIGKVHIIYSLDNGQSKTDLARQYGVHPQTIAYIYKQKELNLKKYTQKYNQLKELSCINLDQSLLDWLKVQISKQNPIYEENLHNKAQEIIQHLNEKLVDIDDWLLDFQLRHHVVKHSPAIQHSVEAMEEWKTFSMRVDTEELYIGGTCALAHSFSMDSYIAKEQPHDYMSVFFIVHTLGSNKRKLAVVGKEHLISEWNIASLPVNYYCNNGQINHHTILSHLKEWDIELTTEQKTVVLILNMSNGCQANFKFNNIKVININMDFLSNTLEKIVECFKYHYRKLQITRITEQRDLHLGHLDYINMIGLAWFSVPDTNIKQLFYPPIEGSLHLKANDACDGKHSLLRWCQKYNVPLNLQLYGGHIDELIFCDKELKSIDLEDATEAFELNTNPRSASGMEAYQAIKRLLSYVQSENASDYVVNSVKFIENHLEYGSLSEIHQIIASSSTE